MLKFVNITNPSDTTAAATKKIVRSHVARDRHARDRQGRTRWYRNAAATREASSPGGDSGSLKARAGDDTGPIEEKRAALTRTPRTTPASILDNGQRDPFDVFIRRLTPLEAMLFDHYVNWVIPFSSADCENPRLHWGLYSSGMRGIWVPVTQTDTGLLAGALLASCRSMARLHGSQSAYYSALCLRYKAECIRSANEAISQDLAAGRPPRDETIGKAMALASDEFVLGNVDAWSAHAEGVRKMTVMRGGTDRLGLEGFLSQLVIWFISDSVPRPAGASLLLSSSRP